MKNLTFNTRYALVTFSKSELENYDYKVKHSDNDLEWLEEEAQDSVYENATQGCTIVEKTENGIVDYYTKESL